jgi:hypothetical protein
MQKGNDMHVSEHTADPQDQCCLVDERDQQQVDGSDSRALGDSPPFVQRSDGQRVPISHPTQTIVDRNLRLALIDFFGQTASRPVSEGNIGSFPLKEEDRWPREPDALLADSMRRGPQSSSFERKALSLRICQS